MATTNKYHLTFNKGIDTKTDPMLVVAPSLLTQFNGRLTRAGTWTKRNGYAQLSNAILGGGSITSGQTLATFDRELLLFNNGTGYSYAASAAAWVNKGSITPVTLTEDTIVRNTAAQSNPDADSVNGVTVFAWEDGRGGIYARVLDESTGALYQADTNLSATGTRPKVVALSGGTICVLYAEGANLRFQSVLTTAPTTFTAAVTVDTNMNATPVIDAVAAFGSQAVVVAWRDSGTATRLAYVTNTGVLGSGATGYPSEITIAVPSDLSIGIVNDVANGAIWIGMGSATSFKAAAYSSNAFVAIVAPILIDSSVAVNGIIATISGTTATWTYQISAASTYNYLLEQNTLTLAGAVGTKAVYLRSVGLGSKPFVYNGLTYFWAVYQSTLQPTAFLLRLDATAPFIVAKGDPGASGGLYTSGVIPRVYSPSTGKFTVATVATEQILNTVTVNSSGQAVTTVPSGGVPTTITSYYLNGIDRLDTTFTNPAQYSAVQLAENLHLAGGFLSIYDGQGFTEHNFHLYPENVVATPSSAGGSMATDTYTFMVCWYWQDAKGQLHRSAPSVPVSTAVTGPTGSVSLTVPTLRLTSKVSPRSKVHLAVFRASTANQTFFRVGNGAANPVTAPVYNDTTVDTVTFSVTVADATISANEVLYTTGGVVENLSIGAPSLIAQSLNRVFLAGVVNHPNTVFYSKPNVAGLPVEFSLFFSVQVSSNDGPITAISVMDGTIFVFKANSIYAFNGQGPDALGSSSSNTFSAPILITTDVGCSAPQSMTITKDGLMFSSPKGIYVLTRSLIAEYVGWPVEAVNKNAVTSGTLIAGTNEVRFTFSNGNRAVYDYLFKEWCLDTNSTALDAVNWNGTFSYLTSSGLVFTETPSVYLDGNQSIQMFVETAWLPMNGLQGFQSLVEGHFLGTFYAPHQMLVAIAYNYQAFDSEIKPWNPSTVLSGGAAYGADVYGATIYGGTSVTVNQFRFKPSIHKCESVKFKFYDQGGNGGGYSISGLDLSWIALDKNFPMRSSQSL